MTNFSTGMDLPAILCLCGGTDLKGRKGRGEGSRGDRGEGENERDMDEGKEREGGKVE